MRSGPRGADTMLESTGTAAAADEDDGKDDAARAADERPNKRRAEPAVVDADSMRVRGCKETPAEDETGNPAVPPRVACVRDASRCGGALASEASARRRASGSAVHMRAR